MRADPEDLQLAVRSFPPRGILSRMKALQAVLIGLEKAAGAEMFQGFPDAWFDPGPRWRCPSGCVLGGYIKSELEGAVCAKHWESVFLTFPEDM